MRVFAYAHVGFALAWASLGVLWAFWDHGFAAGASFTCMGAHLGYATHMFLKEAGL